MTDGRPDPCPPTRERFHRRIVSLQGAVAAVGHEVHRSIAESTDAWLRRDCDAGCRIDARRAGWSGRARQVELAAYELIATQQPMAVDLRQLTTLVRLTETVSRSGDLVAHIARSACFERDSDAFSPALRALVAEMAAVAAAQFSAGLAAYACRDSDAAQHVERADDELDVLTAELFATLLIGTIDTAPAVDLALLGRFYERIGDHAVDIAHCASFVATGEQP